VLDTGTSAGSLASLRLAAKGERDLHRLRHAVLVRDILAVTKLMTILQPPASGAAFQNLVRDLAPQLLLLAIFSTFALLGGFLSHPRTFLSLAAIPSVL
jgi:hypothetical protein